MCGRYYRKGDKQKIAEAFHAKLVEDGTPSPPWDYNVAPTTIQPIIRNSRDTNEREVVSIRWGLIPFFTKSLKDVKGVSTINARAETVAKSPTYREPFKKRRCLVPASGFYEWKRLDEKNKQPFAFDLLNGRMMAFAGLWDGWKDPANGQWLQSYTIITTDANELMAPVHNRMPVILHPSDYDRWLDRDSDPGRPPLDLLLPIPRRRDGSLRGQPRRRQCQEQLPRTVEQQVTLSSRCLCTPASLTVHLAPTSATAMARCLGAWTSILP